MVCLHPEDSFQSRIMKSQIVQAAGGLGIILIDEMGQNLAILFMIPGAIVDNKVGAKIHAYINTTRFPAAYILPAEIVFGLRPAPQVLAFSSKGPNTLTPDILKPDLTAPGLNILAAWSPVKKGMHFNLASGTSMACPHVSGIAAHPSWTPSAIKSALMTTDKNKKIMTAAARGRTANPFGFGAGLLNPVKVENPGLLYDAGPKDYINFLCGIGYDNSSLRRVTGDHSVCTKFCTTASNLNYPSISISKFNGNSLVVRTVTNVGNTNSTYIVRVSPTRGISVQVVPSVLKFNFYGQNISFTVQFKRVIQTWGYVFGSLSWENGRQRVRIPLVVGCFAS